MGNTTNAPALPPQMVLYQLAIGHYFSRALSLAAKLGLADLLKDGPRSADDLAQATKTHAPSLRRVIRLLTSVGVFEERDDGRYALTSVGECLRADAPGSFRAMALMFGGERMHESWKDLEYCVETGEPTFRKKGLANAFAEGSRTPEEAAVFDAAMAAFTRLTAMAVVAAYDFSPFRVALDVGGGNGALLIGILQANPHLHGIVYDQADVAERAKAQIAADGLSDRCKAVGGDFFREVPGGADAYLLKHVIHDWNDEDATKILTNCRRAMSPAAKLLLVEGVYPPHIDQSLESRGAAANDVNMLVNTGGRQRSHAEFVSLYRAAGFELVRIVPTQGRVSVIEGVLR